MIIAMEHGDQSSALRSGAAILEGSVSHNFSGIGSECVRRNGSIRGGLAAADSIACHN